VAFAARIVHNSTTRLTSSDLIFVAGVLFYTNVPTDPGGAIAEEARAVRSATVSPVGAAICFFLTIFLAASAGANAAPVPPRTLWLIGIVLVVTIRS